MKASEGDRRLSLRYLAAAPVAIGLFAASPAAAASTCSQLVVHHSDFDSLVVAG